MLFQFWYINMLYRHMNYNKVPQQLIYYHLYLIVHLCQHVHHPNVQINYFQNQDHNQLVLVVLTNLLHYH